jgi:hypothetical protein
MWIINLWFNTTDTGYYTQTPSCELVWSYRYSGMRASMLYLLIFRRFTRVGIDCADICLTRGAKRKLTQSSLFNFRFSKKVAVEPTSKSLDNELETKAMNQFDEDSSSDKAFLSLNSETEFDGW